VLGLFLYLFFPGALPLGADPGFSVSAEAGPLWVDDEGAAFMLLDAGFPSLRLGRQKKTRLSLGLKKLFVVPWGYERALRYSPASPGAPDPATDERLKTLLLSGLSFYCSLYW
jgi:hypothetical protein